MSDEALRGSERAWRGAGGAGALARLVHARVRAGALPPEAAALAEALDAGRTDEARLLAAALVGHPWVATLLAEPLERALSAHGLLAAVPVARGWALAVAPEESWAAWLAALERLADLETLGDALLAVGRRALLEARPRPADPIAAERDREEVDRLVDDLATWVESSPGSHDPGHLFQLLETFGGPRAHVDALVGRTARVLMAAPADRRELLGRWLGSARALLSPDALRAAVRDAVAPSRLGLEPGGQR